MKISGGMAEISFGRNIDTGSVKNRFFIWPDYRQNAVEKIRRVDPYKNEQIYYKPGLEDREKILGMMHRVEEGYNSSGKAESMKSLVAPGSFFNALA